MSTISAESTKIVRRVNIPKAGDFVVELEPIATTVFKARCRFERLPTWWRRTVTAKLGWMEPPASIEELVVDLATECWAAMTSSWEPENG